MAPYLLVSLTGLLYVLFVGLLGLLRREGVSLRFTVEALSLTGIVAGISALTGADITPAFFVLALWSIAMHVRLLVDLGNLLARRHDHDRAAQVYQLARRLGPDEAG